MAIWNVSGYQWVFLKMNDQLVCFWLFCWLDSMFSKYLNIKLMFKPTLNFPIFHPPTLGWTENLQIFAWKLATPDILFYVHNKTRGDTFRQFQISWLNYNFYNASWVTNIAIYLNIICHLYSVIYVIWHKWPTYVKFWL